MATTATILALSAATLFATIDAHAQSWPTKPVKFIVPQGAGGTTDVFGRYIGQKLSAKWGQPVVVENKVGAAGVVARTRQPRRPRTATRCWSRMRARRR